MRSLLLAVQFLTVVPLRVRGEVRERELAAALRWFPLTGALIGLLPALLWRYAAFWPAPARAALVVALLTALGGGLHLDGLADTADGFYGRRSRERILEIMKDSRIGAMGAIGLCTVLLLKFALVLSLPVSGWRFLVLAPLAGRWCQVLACARGPAARPDGAARPFIDHIHWSDWTIASLTALAGFVGLAGWRGLALAGLTLAAAALLHVRLARRIGGMTGDTIGAISECAETVLLAAAFVVFPLARG